MALRIRVKLFAAEARAAGAREVTVSAERGDCAAVRAALECEIPALRPLLPHCRFAVNHEFAAPDQAVSENDEIALIGAVSGG